MLRVFLVVAVAVVVVFLGQTDLSPLIAPKAFVCRSLAIPEPDREVTFLAVPFLPDPEQAESAVSVVSQPSVVHADYDCYFVHHHAMVVAAKGDEDDDDSAGVVRRPRRKSIQQHPFS